jgi:hypothetical protein
MGGLPTAIKIRLLMNREASSTSDLIATTDVYETIVRLPMAMATTGMSAGSTSSQSSGESASSPSDSTGGV